ncbi:bifunctional precorrin-2 dehydrogenase/sirohydrochlorin ferrochelatase [Halovivax sp.]|uniref:precorrin-2 dehydrogenase/sirohydrochlorin ferrochelatase family protein n=1 Tax=Halovivax sp. TaxID=1935978 RepID=UPI0025C33D4F|nr:bifunctional precorrin-2 dehydrogenase/sirohydrochlorin ferrochelatase [Halovivax sp.]
MIPLLHDFTGETVLIFGGGPVGARKARRFAREARVVVVSPAFADADFGGAELVRAAPDPDDAAAWLDRVEPALVVAATDDEAVNDAVALAARERGVLRNRADRAGGDRAVGSVVVPATVREDPVVVAIATGGRAPALSRHLRRKLEDELEGAGEMATVLEELRAEFRERGMAASRRRAALRSVASSSAVWTTLRTGDVNVENVIEDVLECEGGDRP